MTKLNFEFDYWEQLKKYMLETYPDKIVFLCDSELSFFDAEEAPLVKPRLYSFESSDEFVKWFEDSWLEGGEKINLLSELGVLWVNGVIDQKLIYKIRG